MSQREWTTLHLRRMPELRHFDQADPLAIRWGKPLHAGWRLSLRLSLLVIALWTLLCLLVIVGCVNLLWKSPSDQVREFLEVASGCVMIGWLPGCFAMGYLVHRAVRRHARRLLRSELRCRGMPICLKCGYEGGDIKAPKCPECGAAHNWGA